MERHGEPIATYPIKVLNTGITYTASFPGLVAQIEEREACHFSGYDWKEWQALPYYDRVECVAYFRVKRRIEMNENEARERAIRKKPKGRR